VFHLKQKNLIMASHIQIYAELHWAVQRPYLIFRVNNHVYEANYQIVDAQDCVEKIIFSIYADLAPTNNLEIEMQGKTDALITQESDHWADIKNIMINCVPADNMLLHDSEFTHTMPESWVAQMHEQGIDILPKYQPGTSLRLNGICRWQFRMPFTLQKIMNLWSWQ